MKPGFLFRGCIYRLFSLIALLLFLSNVYAGIGEWKSYTDMKGVVGIVAAENALWAATRGGLFRFSLSDSSLSTFTNSEGLTSNNLTAIAVDNAARIYVGASNGAIDIYDPKSNKWEHILDILLSGKIRRGITGFYQQSDSIFISSDFGVSLYLQSRSEFRETYSKFGSFPSSIRVNGLIIASGRIWVATPSGVASADLQNLNLLAPSAWTTYTLSNGLPSNNANAIVFFNGTIYVGTDAGLAKLVQSSWQLEAALGARQISRLAVIGNRLYAAVDNELYSVGTDGVVSLVGPRLPASINTLGSDGSGAVVLGVEGNGMGFLKGSTWSFKYPNGPASNLFISLKVDLSGILYAASGINNRGKGFYTFDVSVPSGRQWTNYSVSTHPELIFNDYYKVSLGTNNSKWISSWGRGVARVD